jgi:GH15 family glucan-1,4-alpha-glucosidase
MVSLSRFIEAFLTFFFWLVKGEKLFPEMELTHLDGHKGSKPVRIGNGAIDHIQLVSRLHAFGRKSVNRDIYRIYTANCAVDRYSHRMGANLFTLL